MKDIQYRGNVLLAHDRKQGGPGHVVYLILNWENSKYFYWFFLTERYINALVCPKYNKQKSNVLISQT